MWTILMRKIMEQVRKLEAERVKLLKHVKNTTFTVQNVSDVVDIPENLWWESKMFNAELKNAGHVARSKMGTFIVDQGSKMDAILKEMKALISSCTKLFPIVAQSSEEGKISLSYSDLTPHNMVEMKGAAVRGRNQHVEEVD